MLGFCCIMYGGLNIVTFVFGFKKNSDETVLLKYCKV